MKPKKLTKQALKLRAEWRELSQLDADELEELKSLSEADLATLVASEAAGEAAAVGGALAKPELRRMVHRRAPRPRSRKLTPLSPIGL